MEPLVQFTCCAAHHNTHFLSYPNPLEHSARYSPLLGQCHVTRRRFSDHSELTGRQNRPYWWWPRHTPLPSGGQHPGCSATCMQPSEIDRSQPKEIGRVLWRFNFTVIQHSAVEPKSERSDDRFLRTQLQADQFSMRLVRQTNELRRRSALTTDQSLTAYWTTGSWTRPWRQRTVLSRPVHVSARPTTFDGRILLTRRQFDESSSS